LASITSISIAALSYIMARFGAGFISKDTAVLAIAHAASPSLFIAVVASILAVAVDGALMASRDFSYMLIMGLGTFIGQLILLQRCTSVSDILLVFALRLGTYAVAAVSRIMLGFGSIGRQLKGNNNKLAIAR
jgi:Na+-driven multidrug efflux pump